MPLNCQNVEIKKIPHNHLTTDIVNFTSAVCAIALESNYFDSILLKQTLGTGLIQGGTISLNPDNTKFNIASGFGYIVNNWTDPSNPIFSTITWQASSGISDAHISEYISTDLFISGNNELLQTSSRVSQDNLRDYIFLGRTVHPNLSTITTVASLPHVRTNLPLLLDDLISAIGVININGNVISPSVTPLSLKRSSGSIFRLGSNFQNSSKIPNTINLSPADPVNLLYRYRNGSGGYSTQSNRTTVNPLSYDNGSGTLQPVPNKYFTIQRIYQFTTGLTYITYGQTVYKSLSLAVESINSETPDIDIQLNDACLLAFLVIGEQCTDLNNSLECKIVLAGKFSGTGGSSSSSGGTIIGPISSINNSFARFDGTTGSILKDNADSSTLDDQGNANFNGSVSAESFFVKNQRINFLSTSDSSSPVSGISMFLKTDDKFYLKNSNGVETDLTSIADQSWSAYNVNWSAAGGTTPNIGDGSLTGRFRKIGKTVFVNIKWVAGNSTTFGSPNQPWRFSLPFSAVNPDAIILNAIISDSNINWYQGTGTGNYANLTDRFSVVCNNSVGGTSTPVMSGFPIIWGATDSITIGGCYESI